jgi:hypothetical protein
MVGQGIGLMALVTRCSVGPKIGVCVDNDSVIAVLRLFKNRTCPGENIIIRSEIKRENEILMLTNRKGGVGAGNRALLEVAGDVGGKALFVGKILVEC